MPIFALIAIGAIALAGTSGNNSEESEDTRPQEIFAPLNGD